MDKETIKAQCDLRVIIEQDLGKPKHSSSQYNAYHCPFHREKQGHSFVVYKDHWKCYGKCNESGDVFEWLKRQHSMSFVDAMRYLGGDTRIRRRAVPAAKPEPELPSEPPSIEWQQRAAELVDIAERCLWSPTGERALKYLMEVRGLFPSIIKEARLGYIPADDPKHNIYGRVVFKDWLKPDGKPYRCQCGIIIPHFADGALWNVRCRTMTPTMTTPPEKSKYEGAIAGGSKALYWSDAICEGDPFMLLEGEFDALIVYQCCFNIINPVALASASNKYINQRFGRHFNYSRKFFARMDNDDAGRKALTVLQTLAPFQPVQVPDGIKDVNDFYNLHGLYAVREWVQELIA